MVRKSGKNWSHDLHKIGKYGKEIGEKSELSDSQFLHCIRPCIRPAANDLH